MDTYLWTQADICASFTISRVSLQAITYCLQSKTRKHAYMERYLIFFFFSILIFNLLFWLITSWWYGVQFIKLKVHSLSCSSFLASMSNHRLRLGNNNFQGALYTLSLPLHLSSLLCCPGNSQWPLWHLCTVILLAKQSKPLTCFPHFICID